MLVDTGFDQSIEIIREKLSMVISNTKDLETIIQIQKVVSETNDLQGWLKVDPYIAMCKLNYIDNYTNSL